MFEPLRGFLKYWDDKLTRFIAYYVFKKQYIRRGKCLGCGKCCESIYVRHSGGIVKTDEEFERLKLKHFFYTWLEVIDRTEDGLAFRCTKLKDGRCTEYKNRALICRKYPTEEIFSLGAELGKECGFYFEPIKKFEDIFNKLLASKQNAPTFVIEDD